jgi:hypothetical protein
MGMSVDDCPKEDYCVNCGHPWWGHNDHPALEVGCLHGGLTYRDCYCPLPPPPCTCQDGA